MAVVHPQAYGKMLKSHGEAPTDFERVVANLVLDIQNSSDLKPQMEELYITKAQEVPVGEKGHVRAAVVIWVPPPQLKAWHRIYTRLVRELEKKLDGKHVVFVAQRRILPKPTRKTAFKLKQRRPRSRTLTSVHENMLNDIVYPADIVGKRIRVKRDGSRLIKVHLDKDQQQAVSNKTDTFAAVYKKLTGKAVTFEFPEPIFGREKK